MGDERPDAALGSGSRSLLVFVWVLVASAAAWGVLFVVIPPSAQDFPLIDDWAFARGAFQFARGEGINYFKWASMPELGQWLWAFPWVRILGERFFVLRMSTIVVSWFGLWGFYDLLRQQQVSSRVAAFATTVLAFTPLFFLLEGTFMTDVPSLAFTLLALAFYGRAFYHERFGWLVLGGAACLMAVCTRQNTLAVPIVAGCYLLTKTRLRWNPLWWLGVLVPLAAGMAADLWFRARGDINLLYVDVPTIRVVIGISLGFLETCGLAALPLLVIDPRPGSAKAFVIACAILMPLTIYWWLNAALLPYSGLFPTIDGVVTKWGAYNQDQYAGQRPTLLAEPLRLALTFLGCVGAALLVGRFVHQVKSGFRLGPLVLFAILQLPFILAPYKVFDRYFLFLLPAALALALPLDARPGRAWVPGWVLLAVCAITSVALMHDWLDWNRARWELGKQAVAEGKEPVDIEGGLEWNGWHSSEASYLPRGNDNRLTVAFTRLWFPGVTGRYALAFSAVPKSEIIGSKSYSQWLLPGAHDFVLLKEQDDEH